MTAAEELRAAAKLMRERAERASADGVMLPWRTGKRAPCHCCEYVEDAGGARIATLDDRQSDHVAGMHPGVALAVADWLDACAEQAEMPGAFELHALGPGPLATARAYLGGEPG